MTTDPTGRVFISYRRTRLDEIRLLIKALHDRGVPTWQDLANIGMGQGEEQLRETLADLLISGAILWLTPDVADQTMMRMVELPAIIERSRRDVLFFAQLVAAGGLDYAGVSKLGKGATPYDLGAFNLNEVKADPIEAKEAAAVARITLGHRIAILHKYLAPDQPLQIDIYSGTPSPFEPGKALIVDWTQRFESGRKPNDGAWDEFLLPALKDILEVVRVQAPGRSIEFRGLLSLPGAVALGCVFMETCGVEISWRPRQTPDQLWNIRVLRENSDFSFSLKPDTFDGHDLAVLVSVDNDVTPAFTLSTSHLNIEFRAIAQIANPNFSLDVTRFNISSPGQAADIACVVRQAIVSACNKFSEIRRAHLFMAVPAGLAMMIGQLTNTCVAVQTYEFDRNRKCYTPSVLLDPTW